MCDYSTSSKHGISVHIGRKHKEQEKPDSLVDVKECEALVNRNQEEASEIKNTVNSDALNINCSCWPSKVLRCTWCQRTFHSDESFEDHKWWAYSSTKLTKCPLCVEEEPNCIAHASY